MKRERKINKVLVSILVLPSLMFFSCAQDVDEPEKEDETPVVSEESAKISFEEDQYSGDHFYDPDDALTDNSTSITVEQSNVYANDGTYSLKLEGTLQSDKYDDPDGSTLEMGIRVKAATIVDVTVLDIVSKVISVSFYIPAEGTNNAVQFVLQDSGSQQAISNGIEITAGEWNTVYFKLLPSDDAANTKYPNERASLCVVDSEGTTITAQGAYTSESFETDEIEEIEIRTMGSTLDAVAILYVDSIDW